MLNDTGILHCFLSPLHSVHRPACSMSMSNDLPFKKKKCFFSCFCCSVSSWFFHMSACILDSVQPHMEADIGSSQDLPPYTALAVFKVSSKLVLTSTSFPCFLYLCFHFLLSALYWKCSEVKTTSILLSISNLPPSTD